MSERTPSLPQSLIALLIVTALVASFFVLAPSAAPSATPKASGGTSVAADVLPAVGPTLGVSPMHGPVGSLLSLSATGFAASASVSIAWSGGTACTGTTSNTGAFGCTYPMPPSVAGGHLFTATDSASNSASVTFTTDPSLTPSPTGGPVGSSVTFTGSGFAGASPVSVTWTKGTACVSTTDATGAFSCIASIPAGTTGAAYLFNATDGSADSASAVFDVTFLSVTPASQRVNSAVTFSGAGYTAAEPFWVNWTGGVACTGTVSGAGKFSCSLRIPLGTPGGVYAFSGTDGAAVTAETNVTVVPSMTASPTSGTSGTPITFSGSGYTPAATVAVNWSKGIVCTSTIDVSGDFSCGFTLTDAAQGAHTFTGRDSSGGTANAVVTVGTSLLASPTSGPVGTHVTFTATGFNASVAATLIWIGGTACSVTTNASGSFKCTFTIAPTPVGDHEFTAHGSGHAEANVSFNVTPRLVLSPVTSGPVGAHLSFSATGYARSSAFTISWAQGTACSGVTSLAGSFSCTFVVPPATGGNYTFNGSDASSDNVSVVFRVVPSLTVSPPFGPTGTDVGLVANGLSGGTQVWINGTGTSACSGTTSLNGGFSCSFGIPNVPSGFHVFTATDLNGHTASATFTVTGPGVYAVTFKAVGLPPSSVWSVAAGSPATTLSNTTYRSAGKIVFFEQNGTLPFNVTAPANYGISAVTGASAPSQTSGTVAGITVFTVHFGPFENLSFNETGLPSGATWGVTITSSLPHGGPAGQNATTNSSSITFSVVKGSYKFQITPKPVTYTAAPSHGSVGVPTHSVVKNIRFKIVGEKLVFHESGLSTGTIWGVNISGPMNVSLNGSTPTLSVMVENGTYTYSFWKVGLLFPHPANGTITVVGPHAAVAISITYTGTPVAASPAAVGARLVAEVLIAPRV
jgi:hypothetical protein